MKVTRKITTYKERRLPSDTGVVIEPLKGRTKSFIPKEALRKSDEARQTIKPDLHPRDRYSDERVDRRTPAVDSSEETFGG